MCVYATNASIARSDAVNPGARMSPEPQPENHTPIWAYATAVVVVLLAVAFVVMHLAGQGFVGH